AGTGDTVEIEAPMFIEILVLGGNKGIDDELRHRLDREIEPALLGVFGEQLAIGGMHPRHHRRLIVLKLRIVRQIFGKMIEQPGNGSDRDQEHERPRREQEAEKPDQKSHRQPILMSRVGPQAGCAGKGYKVGRAGLPTPSSLRTSFRMPPQCPSPNDTQTLARYSTTSVFVARIYDQTLAKTVDHARYIRDSQFANRRSDVSLGTRCGTARKPRGEISLDRVNDGITGTRPPTFRNHMLQIACVRHVAELDQH